MADLLPGERDALAAFCRWVRDTFRERVCQLSLFGSRARGEGDEFSDLDVVVVIDALTSAESWEVARHAGDILTRYDILLSPLVFSRARFEELRERERLIVREIERDGVAL